MKTIAAPSRRRSNSLSSISARIRKTNARKRSNTVKGVNMLSVMSADQARDISKDFLTTGRTGRRNALPDILGENARTSVADLPDAMGALSTNDGAGCSKDSVGPSPPSVAQGNPSSSSPSTSGQAPPPNLTSADPS